MSGFVSFVSAGPGDPELLTLKAAARLKAADVVLYDDLAAGDVLHHARENARLVSVGKRAGRPSAKQEHVSRLLVDYAATGAAVVRLKSGDSGIFGRLEEEIDALPAVRQPIVLTHPITGRKTLYVGSHARDVVGMDRAEGRALIDELIAWVTQPQYVFSITYRPGDMSIWDNLASLHRGGDFDDVNHRRDMRRTTVKSPPGTHVGTVREPIAA